MKVHSLSLDQLDYWVARVKNIPLTPAPDGQGFFYIPHTSMAPRKWSPTRLWSQGGPIIEEAHIDLNWNWEATSEWTASMEPDVNIRGKTVLESAMRAYVVSRVGEDVDDL